VGGWQLGRYRADKESGEEEGQGEEFPGHDDGVLRFYGEVRVIRICVAGNACPVFVVSAYKRYLIFSGEIRSILFFGSVRNESGFRRIVFVGGMSMSYIRESSNVFTENVTDFLGL
ncbi:MAG: hypothetical protein RBQ80_08600, partial [Methanocorpusculum sp.]|nr:hypothetical protein [Methanocorpusculum sp.]